MLLEAPLLMVPFALLFPTAWGVPFVPLLQLALTWCVHCRWHRLAWSLWGLGVVVTVAAVYALLFSLRP